MISKAANDNIIGHGSYLQPGISPSSSSKLLKFPSLSERHGTILHIPQSSPPSHEFLSASLVLFSRHGERLQDGLLTMCRQ